MENFKVGDKVILCPSSQWYNQQEFDENNNPIPKTIIRMPTSGAWKYEVDEGYGYDDGDLLPFNNEPQYEIY